MKLNEYLDYLVNWLQDVVKNTKTKGLVVGISGGIDSALVAALIKKAFPNNSLGVIIPCFSSKEDVEDAYLVAKEVGIDHIEVNLDETYLSIEKAIFKNDLDDIALAKANIKARLRMTTLYSIAQSKGYLVVGTDNLAEWYTGYFTKYGDGGVDIAPIIHLTKGEVKMMSKLLGINDKIINRVPTAGLIPGVNDEDELGMSYDEIDHYLLGGNIDKNKEDRLKYLHSISEHKRNLALKPNNYNRD